MRYINDITIKSGDRVYFSLTNGKTLLDLTSGATVANLGHGNPKLALALKEQLKLVENTYLFKNIPREKYKSQLLREINKGLTKPVYNEIFFLSTGSESIDFAIKAAYALTGKKKIISTSTSFHGRTINCMELTKLPFSSTIKKGKNVLFVEYPGNEKMEDAIVSAIDNTVRSHTDIATLILEPYQGDGGLLFPTRSFFIKVQKICRKNKVVFILDEIQSGFGRTGSLFYFQQLGITPDIICLGKAMANGLPASAVVSTSGIISSLKPEYVSNSFGGNALSMAVAGKVLSTVSRQKFLDKVKSNGFLFKEKLEKLKVRYPIITSIRGKGMIYGIELNSNIKGIGELFCEQCYHENLLVMPPKGLNKNVIKLSPPLIINRSELKKAVMLLEHALIILTEKIARKE